MMIEIRDEQHLLVLERKLKRLQASLESGRWVGDDSRGRLEAYALEWAIEKLKAGGGGAE